MHVPVENSCEAHLLEGRIALDTKFDLSSILQEARVLTLIVSKLFEVQRISRKFMYRKAMLYTQ